MAGAVILQQPIAGLKDSKKLSKLMRLRLSETILGQALAVGLGWVGAATIDKVGISTAVKMAMQQALDQITVSYDQIIIDGHLNFLNDNPKSTALIKADDTIPTVSAASIVAKVARDAYMTEIAETTHPQYGFDRHVGYGTALHLAMLREHGISNLHRRSYKPVKALL